MPFEAFDKKFEEAAAHHHPVYDEQAWNKMKQLLDKHLPEKKEKKRRFLWIWFLLFFLVAGGGSVWMIRGHYGTNDHTGTAGNNTGMKEKENSSEKDDNNTVSPKQETDNTDRSNMNTTPASKVVTQQNSETPVLINNTKNVSAGNIKEDRIAADKTTGNASAKKVKERKATSVSISSATTKNKAAMVATSSPKNKKVSWLRSADNIDYASTNIVSSKKNKNKASVSSSSKNKRSAKNASPDLSLTAKEKAETDKIDDIVVNNINKNEKNEAEIKENDPVISNNENKISKQVADKPDSAGSVNKDVAEKSSTKLPRKKKSFSNSLGLSISAGPDVSAVGLSQVGSTRIVYGAGLSYQFARKWNIRTGIYTTSKVYHAKPSDYDPPSYFWNYYPSLEKINANCRVYEIPVIISYIIDQQKKHSWFVSAGLSSVIMKRETYDYISKTSTGYETRSYTIDNQNKHWMAEARLSFGYQQHFGNSSFSIEPYINTPLKGVGYGKVKLSGAGILFSVSIKPFAKK